jgi:hypothetical protein
MFVHISFERIAYRELINENYIPAGIRGNAPGRDKTSGK